MARREVRRYTLLLCRFGTEVLYLDGHRHRSVLRLQKQGPGYVFR